MLGHAVEVMIAKREGDPLILDFWLDNEEYLELNKEDNTAFLNNANKVYLPASALATTAQALRLTRDGETSIENAQLTIDNVAIYDLTGRRVEKMEKGIYIVNGKKIIK